MYDTTGGGFVVIGSAEESRAVTTDQYVREPLREAADWRDAVIARLAELERLAPGWDGEGAFPVSRRHANNAVWFLDRIMALDAVEPPEIVPLADGGVQLEWYIDEQTRVDFVSDDDTDPVVLTELADSLSENSARSVELHEIHKVLTGRSRMG